VTISCDLCHPFRNLNLACLCLVFPCLLSLDRRFTYRFLAPQPDFSIADRKKWTDEGGIPRPNTLIRAGVHGVGVHAFFYQRNRHATEEVESTRRGSSLADVSRGGKERQEEGQGQGEETPTGPNPCFILGPTDTNGTSLYPLVSFKDNAEETYVAMASKDALYFAPVPPCPPRRDTSYNPTFPEGWSDGRASLLILKPLARPFLSDSLVRILYFPRC
jgi:hypothetical protein